MTHPNRYPGINPHLNSALQRHDWKGFHNTHLVHLLEAIIPLLPAGYYAKLEDSLQLSARNDAGRFTGADILIRQRSPEKIPSAEAGVAVMTATEISTPTLTMEIFDAAEFVPSVMIYHENRPITRLELLSPANMPGGSHHAEYVKKRDATLYEGVCLVEMDYLHESRPILSRLPSYVDRDIDSFPYMIIVSDPRKPANGMEVYGFGVLDTIPVIAIPLANEKKIVVNFGAVYQRTFAMNPYYFEILTDYAQTPANLATYTPDDQAKILQQMAKIVTEKTD